MPARKSPDPTAQVWLDACDVEARYSKGRSTIDRWLRDPEMGCPKPRYFRKKRAWTMQ